MSDKEKAARAIGYLEGLSAVLWMIVGEKVADEYVAQYDEAVETLRKVIEWDDENEQKI